MTMDKKQSASKRLALEEVSNLVLNRTNRARAKYDSLPRNIGLINWKSPSPFTSCITNKEEEGEEDYAYILQNISFFQFTKLRASKYPSFENQATIACENLDLIFSKNNRFSFWPKLES